jgi:hypothetical protein
VFKWQRQSSASCHCGFPTNYLTGPGGAGVTVSDTTAQMFDPADPDRPVKAFLQEYQTLFRFGPEALDDANVQRDYRALLDCAVETRNVRSRCRVWAGVRNVVPRSR